MECTEPTNRPWRIDWALATKVILGFWAVHLAARATIALTANGVGELIDPGLDLALFLGFLLSFPVCALLALAARRGLAFALGVVALLSLPASLLYASVELTLFYNLSPQLNAPRKQTLPDGTRVTVSPSGEVVYAKPGVGQQTKINLPSPKQMVAKRAVQLVTRNTSDWYFFYFGLGSFFVGMTNAAQLRRVERRAAQYQQLAQHAQLEALRYQVNPHFLFNTLNSLSALIMGGRVDAAETMILNLSRFFRSTLALDPAGDITLREELRLQRLYLDIEEIRFPDRLRVAIDVPEELLEARVPTLLLQPLVENAIKHGIARRVTAVTLSITARRMEANRFTIVVENEAGATAAEDDGAGTGTGLRNVEQRLQARFGDAAACIAGPSAADLYRVVIALPLVIA